jgi:hypothetical protein
MSQSRLASSALALVVASCLPANPAWAGNEANFVLYDHHTDEKGETEVNLFSDFSNAVGDEPRYSAQLFELERALTDLWEAALYLEGDNLDGEDYLFSGLRIESRYRLFDYGAFLNPVLYVEYESLHPDHKYLLDVTGRTDTPEGPEETWEHEIETKLIVGHDITKKLDVAFNWINETHVDTGRWEFGYALGFNYALVGEANEEAEEHGEKGHEHHSKGEGWAIKEVKLGGEVYGGLGDSTLGLTLDPNVTQQYAGLNLKTEWTSGLHFMVGGATGLTKESERGLLRLMVGYEFE